MRRVSLLALGRLPFPQCGSWDGRRRLLSPGGTPLPLARCPENHLQASGQVWCLSCSPQASHSKTGPTAHPTPMEVKLRSEPHQHLIRDNRRKDKENLSFPNSARGRSVCMSLKPASVGTDGLSRNAWPSELGTTSDLQSWASR